MRRSYWASPKIMMLEGALVYKGDGETVEVTPGSIRLRKVVLHQSRMRMKGGKM